MGLYPGGLKRGIDFALEPEWAYIWVDLYPGGSLFATLRYVCRLQFFILNLYEECTSKQSSLPTAIWNS